MLLQKLPLDLSTFRALREKNYVYVDKTEHAYRMITGGHRYFLSRPRRFGKSLFVSTLKEILEGNRALFGNLWIDTSDYQWQQHGVIVLDISMIGSHSPDIFRKTLCKELERIADNAQVTIPTDRLDPTDTLKDLVYALHGRFGHVAILVDEYDSLILRALYDPERARAMREVIRDFFSAIKGLDSYIDFVFITGISSFVRAGLFSGINNLRIITLDEQYASICGYTDADVDRYFHAYIQAWALKEQMSYDTLRKQLREWYDGYHFGKHVPAIYNPFSLMNALSAKEYGNYWFQSGTPTFFVEVLKREYTKFDPEHFEATKDLLQNTFDVAMVPLISLMFQAGYLTITGYDHEQDIYTLNYPNSEVQKSLQVYLLEAFARLDYSAAEYLSAQLRAAFNRQEMDELIFILKQLFAHVPYQLHMKEEKFYHALLQMACTAAGLKAQSEYSTSHGRIDLIIELPSAIYVIEIKFNQSAEVALEQIEERRYYERFLHSKKKIILLGLAFRREPTIFDIMYAKRELA